MPMFIREPVTSGMGVFSPLKSNLEDMIATCEVLDKELAIIAEDGEEFGGLSEESFCYTAPVRSRFRMVEILANKSCSKF
jgi:hypothetical protein